MQFLFHFTYPSKWMILLNNMSWSRCCQLFLAKVMSVLEDKYHSVCTCNPTKYSCWVEIRMIDNITCTLYHSVCTCNPIYNWTNKRALRTMHKTTTCSIHCKAYIIMVLSTQYIVNSCLFNHKSDYSPDFINSIVYLPFGAYLMWCTNYPSIYLYMI